MVCSWRWKQVAKQLSVTWIYINSLIHLRSMSSVSMLITCLLFRLEQKGLFLHGDASVNVWLIEFSVRSRTGSKLQKFGM